MTSRRTPRTVSLLETRARALRRFLPAAIAGDEHGVHQARVASRRLREAVPVLAEGLRHTKSRKALRKLRRLTAALGAVRELDVTLRLLEELEAADDLSRAALQEVRLHVVAERDRRRETMLNDLAAVNAEKLDRRLAAVGDAVRDDASDGWRRALARRLVNRARRLTGAIDTAGQLYAPEHLHQVRIAAKKLRYGLELGADARVPGAPALVSALKRTQVMLGRLHDLQTLQGHVAAVQAAPQSRPELHEALGAVAGRIEEQCRLLHGKYVASVTALRGITAATRSDIVPRLAGKSPALKMVLARGRKTARTAG